MVNGPDHIEGQEFFIKLLEEYGYECKTDFPFRTGTRVEKYYFDVYAEKSNCNGWFYISKTIALPIWNMFDTIVIEVDGKIGYSTKRAYYNRQVKKEFCRQHDFRFFEFPTNWIVGENKLDKESFLEEIKPIRKCQHLHQHHQVIV